MVDPTINQTGGHTGVTRGIDISPTLTAAANYTGLYIGVNSANAKGIYQIGSATVNNLEGKTAIGSTSTPTRTLNVTGEMRVTDLVTDNPTVLLGADGDGDFSSVTLGSGFSYSGTTLNFTEGDASTTNEIQTIDTFSIVSNTLRLSLSSDGQPYKSVSLASYLDNTDSQTLSLDSTTIGSIERFGLTISGGNKVYFDVNATAGTGDVLQNGNSFATAMTIGTNDNNTLNFETNNVTRMSITGGASTGGAVTMTNVTTNTSSTQDVLTVQSNSTGTAAAGFGPALLFQGESSTTDNQDIARISAIWTTATHASRTSDLVFSNVVNGSSSEHFRIVGGSTPTLKIGAGSTTYSNSAITIGTSFTIGNSSSLLTLGNSGGQIMILSSGNLASTVLIEGNGTGVNCGVTFGNSLVNNTSGTVTKYQFAQSFSPSSGTAVFNTLAFNNTFNQTGGANGITRSMYVNPTLTSVADYRALDIAANSANAKGIYQSGASTTNNLVGNTRIGSTSAPARKLDVTGEVRISDLTTDNPTRIVGADADGDLNEITIGSGLSLSGTTIS